MQDFFKRGLTALFAAAVAVPSVATGFYLTYRFVTLFNITASQN